MKPYKIIIGAILLSMILLIVWLCSASGVYYKTYSPDNQYSVYAKKYNWESFIPKMPGGSGDASGKVFLYDEVEHKTIGKAEITMISMTGDIKWDENSACFVGEDYPNALNPWKLPRPVKQPKIVIEEDTISLEKVVREYALDNSLKYESKMKIVNGCQKTIAWKSYHNKQLQTEWNKEYATDSNQTCDFSAYILYQNDYENGKLKLKSEYYAGSDQSEEVPCGSWIYYDSKGKITKTENRGKCDISKFGRN